MMKLAATCIVLTVFSVGVLAQAPAAKPIDYETYCKLPDPESKRAAFMATTAENRGTLVRTQMERWRDANLARLNDKQKASLDAVIKSITSDSYVNGPQGEEARVKSRALISEMETLFTMDDLMAMQPNAPCIVKK
jgi:hypothetical protein